MSKLSIIILAGNEAEVIKGCLQSCQNFDEIVLVAANSTDATKTIAKEIFPKIKIVETFDEYNKNFSKWRNLGFKKSTGDWLFYLDADERLTPSLAAEINDVVNVKNLPHSYYIIPRANYFLGHRVKHGGTYPDYVKRLFYRPNFSGFEGVLHEEPKINGTMGRLKSDILHYTHRSLTSMLTKTIAWTELEAQALYDNHHPPVVWWRFPRMMLTKFWERFIRQQMYKDGTVGIISVIFEMFDTFIIYARLWEIQTNASRHL